MYIIICTQKISLEDILLILKPTEAKELFDALGQLLGSEDIHHLHVNDDEYQKEITICVQQSEDLSEYSNEIREIISENSV